ncbi:hypothetical protein [Loktanella sp. R86503]|uniref:hypothetical protein n=1 Tax=Loktanella sp. R86503 TaxID=3093847 RepID=UPI0036DF8C86
MTRILLHPGFHKTGTSSIQHFLWHNRAVLAPHAVPVLLRHLKPVVRMACRYSRYGNPADLIDIVDGMDAAIKQAEPRANQDIILSCEGLLGHLPGWPGVDSYAAAPALLTYLTGYFQDRYPKAQFDIVLTTRDPDSWLFSAYRHHLRGQRMTLSAAEFAATYVEAGNLNSDVNAIAAALGGVSVQSLDLSVMRDHPLGPGGAICSLLDLPAKVTASLSPVGAGNAGPEQSLWQQFLDLNRSDLDDRAAQAAKAELARTTDLGGWRQS